MIKTALTHYIIDKAITTVTDNIHNEFNNTTLYVAIDLISGGYNLRVSRSKPLRNCGVYNTQIRIDDPIYKAVYDKNPKAQANGWDVIMFWVDTQDELWYLPQASTVIFTIKQGTTKDMIKQVETYMDNR